MINISVDIETLGVSNNSIICTVGAVVFDYKNQRIGESYYQRIGENPKNRVSDADTVNWWLSTKVDQRARYEIYTGESRMPFDDFLDEFSKWVERQGKDVCIWSKGPLFDEAILQHAYKHADKHFPFHYRNSRCVRTILQLAKDLGLEMPKRIGCEHNAFNDAIYQAKCVNEFYRTR